MNSSQIFCALGLGAALLWGGLAGCDGASTSSPAPHKAEARAPESAASTQAHRAKADEHREARTVNAEADDALARDNEAPQRSAQEPPESEVKSPPTAVLPGAKGESTKRKKIRKLLEITGSAKLGLQVVDQMIASFKQGMPNVPDKFWTEFRKDLDEQGLIDLIVPIYDKHLTETEVTKLLEFYQTPVGKSYIKKLPAITRESQMAGQKWGREIGQKVMRRLQKEGYR